MNRKPACPRCRHRGFKRDTAPDGRPRFTCNSCGNQWTSGRNGGEYAGHAMNERGDQAAQAIATRIFLLFHAKRVAKQIPTRSWPL